MAIPRSAIRESAFIIIFEKSFSDDDLDTIFENALISLDDDKEIVLNNDVKALVSGVYDKSEELDKIIAKFSNKRSFERIPKINLAILRLALYEANYDDKVPVNVAISEAVLIAKKYAQKPDVSFINGVLGAYSRNSVIKGEEVKSDK